MISYICFQYDTDYFISKTVYYLQCNIEVYQLCIYIVHKKYEYNVVLFVKLIHLFCSRCDNGAFEDDSSDSDVPLAEVVTSDLN